MHHRDAGNDDSSLCSCATHAINNDRLLVNVNRFICPTRCGRKTAPTVGLLLLGVVFVLGHRLQSHKTMEKATLRQTNTALCNNKKLTAAGCQGRPESISAEHAQQIKKISINMQIVVHKTQTNKQTNTKTDAMIGLHHS